MRGRREPHPEGVVLAARISDSLLTRARMIDGSFALARARSAGRPRPRLRLPQRASTTRRTPSPTVVSTGVLRPYQAVIWAAFFNLLAIGVFELKVASTIGKGIIAPEYIDAHLIFGALIGAIAWNLITPYYGIPSSSSHALIGGLIGAGHRESGRHPAAGARHPQDRGVHLSSRRCWGLVLGALIMVGVSWIFFRSSPHRVDKLFRPSAARSRPRSTASAMAAMTRRRRWASSGCCSSPRA